MNGQTVDAWENAERLRFRLWIDGYLVSDEWATQEDGAEDLAERQAALIAENSLRPYLVEIYNPVEPEDQAYIRFGTDDRGMVDPLAPIDVEGLEESIYDELARRSKR